MTRLNEIGFYCPADSSYSDAGSSLRESIFEMIVMQTSMMAEVHRAALKALSSASIEAGRPNWDGHGARSISQGVIDHTEALLLALPNSLPSPAIVPEADGELALEWQTSPRRTFSVSVGRDGSLSFAGLFGHNRVFGTETPSHHLPESILAGIRRASHKE